MELKSRPKLRVWRDPNQPAAYAWRIDCPVNDCEIPADGINWLWGWADQETACRVAERHWREHKAQYDEIMEIITPPMKGLWQEWLGTWKQVQTWMATLASLGTDTHKYQQTWGSDRWDRCTYIITQADGVERQCGELKGAACHTKEPDSSP